MTLARNRRYGLDKMADTGERGRASSLERARWARGYSREFVARALGLSAKTVERHEKSQRRIKRRMLARYADLYEVDVETLSDMAVIANGGEKAA